jgi:hypothetical protein
MTRKTVDGDGGGKRSEERDRGRGGEGAYLELADFEYVKVDLSLAVESLLHEKGECGRREGRNEKARRGA